MKHKLTKVSILLLVGLVVFGVLFIVMNPYNPNSELNAVLQFGKSIHTPSNNNLNQSTGSSNSTSNISPSSGLSQSPIASSQTSSHGDDGSSSGPDDSVSSALTHY
jgi:hypothetical protein